ncbi:BlaR1 peptidase M56 [Mariniflexile fucanivorans]|uniref:BlaR1 peptidase M56 n=1 Tax=Mariniflexile fucanivorans TaxID=264023 RepID=A0A4R1RIX3_9FLAO|nr:M56 family metallopeptidase [Mariniflexile fucanivorans]TCL66055.1 BlaR1 peptidase M56 [Mariniflexile fucanivorans]
MEYLLKVSAIIAIFYLSYKIFLQRETFFEQNRWFLLMGLITSFLLPFLVIPIYIEATPLDFSGYVFETTSVNENFEKPFNILDYLPLAYGIGVLFFSIRFLVQFTSLALVIFKNQSGKTGRFIFIKTTNSVSPFSFFNWIVYNPAQFSSTELEQIITHEKVHANQKHSLDILLTHLSCIVLWFNPFIWLFSNLLKQNLEFIADKETAKQTSCKKNYQYTLLKTSMPSHQVALSNSFYNSSIKKRIVMLQKSKSKKINQLKYALIIPVLGLFLMSFNNKEVYVEKLEVNLENVNQTEPEPPLYFVDGNETSKKDVESINPENIDSINVLKGKVAIEKYGAKGKHGVVEITTKWKTEFIIGKPMDSVKVTGYAQPQDSVLKTKIGTKINATNNENQLNPWKITIGRNAVSYPDTDTLKWQPTKKRVGLNWVSEEENKVSLSSTNESNIKMASSNGKELLYFIDGKESKKNEMDNLQHYNIESINVLKDDMAIEKYGEKGKYGVIEVTTKKKPRSEWKISTERNTNVIYAKKDTIYVQKKPNLFKELDTNKNNQPLYLLNGKEISRKELGKLNELNIESVSEIKDSKYAIEKYGEKGKYGVVEIKTKTDNSKTPIVKVIGKAIYILDGKEVKKEVYDKIYPDEIESVNVLKGNAAIKKYGNKAKNGVVEITTKKKE